MRGGRENGFTYVAVLILVATLGAVSAAFGELTSHAAQREKEQELLFVGNQFRQALWNYFLIVDDGSAGVHNPAYVRDLLAASIDVVNNLNAEL